jgi:hypothetical protein
MAVHATLAANGKAPILQAAQSFHDIEYIRCESVKMRTLITAIAASLLLVSGAALTNREVEDYKVG